MHYSIFALAALAATSSAHAIDLQKRRVFTVTKYVDVWTTTTIYGSAPSAAAALVNGDRRKGVDRGGNIRHRSSAKAAVPSVAAAEPSVAAAEPSIAAAAPSVAAAEPSIAAAVPSIAAAASAAPAASSADAAQEPSSVVKVIEQPTASSVPAIPPPTTGSYQETVLYHHNVHRANHSAPALVWNQDLADTALNITMTCKYEHQMDVNGGGYGQNIAAGVPISDISFVISEQFYNGEVTHFTDYGQDTPADMDDNFGNYGHFTAVVWKGTTSVGCVSYDCSKTGLSGVDKNVPPIFHVCNYAPSGKLSSLEFIMLSFMLIQLFRQYPWIFWRQCFAISEVSNCSRLNNFFSLAQADLRLTLRWHSSLLLC